MEMEMPRRKKERNSEILAGLVTEAAQLATIAQSFSPFSSRDGQQVCHPDSTRATNLFSKI
jgi:hypothetical protein